MFPFWDMSGGMGWWMLFGGVFTIIFWGGLIALIVWGITRLAKRDNTTKGGPLDIAKERYAKGEITREEFEQFKKDLF